MLLEFHSGKTFKIKIDLKTFKTRWKRVILDHRLLNHLFSKGSLNMPW